MALGLLLLVGSVGGKLAARVGLPRISGYLAVAVLMGPYSFGLLTADMLAGRELIDGVAVALTAGGEIGLSWLKSRLRAVSTIIRFELGAVLLGMFATFLAVQHLFGVIPRGAIPDREVGVLIVAALFAAVAVTNSPAVTIAVINETRAQYLARIGREPGAFVLAACFLMWLGSALLHLELLVVAVAAGFWVENFTEGDQGHRLIRGIESVALPVYATFFAAAGAKIRLDVLLLPTLGLVTVPARRSRAAPGPALASPGPSRRSRNTCGRAS